MLLFQHSDDNSDDDHNIDGTDGIDGDSRDNDGEGGSERGDDDHDGEGDGHDDGGGNVSNSFNTYSWLGILIPAFLY